MHLGAIVFEILRRNLPPTDIFAEDGKWVAHADRLTYADYVSQAFDEIRQSTVALPSLASALVETLADIASDLQAEAIRDEEWVQALTQQARLVVAGVERGCPLPDDAKPVADAAGGLFARLENRPS